MKKIIFIFLCVFMVGCTASKYQAKPITADNGKQAYIVTCTDSPWSLCLERAGETCGSAGYVTLSGGPPKQGSQAAKDEATSEMLNKFSSLMFGSMAAAIPKKTHTSELASSGTKSSSTHYTDSGYTKTTHTTKSSVSASVSTPSPTSFQPAPMRKEMIIQCN